MDSLAFLERAGKGKVQPIYVLHGDEEFLKRQVLRALRTLVLEGEEAEFGLSRYTGDQAAWSDVRAELETLPFLGSRRLVLIDNADPFVSQFRASLEKYVGAPSTTGVLILDVKTWTSTTRLAKMIDSAGTIVCKSLPAARLSEWCSHWAGTAYGKQLTAQAGRLLVEFIGPELGLLDQELAKLAAYVGQGKRIDAEDVDRLVGKSRAANTWKIFEAIGTGQTAQALAILDRLFVQGEAPIMLLGAFSHHYRQLAQATRLTAQGTPLTTALEQAGVPPFAVRSCEQELRHLGRRRAGTAVRLVAGNRPGSEGQQSVIAPDSSWSAWWSG